MVSVFAVGPSAQETIFLEFDDSFQWHSMHRQANTFRPINLDFLSL